MGSIPVGTTKVADYQWPFVLSYPKSYPKLFCSFQFNLLPFESISNVLSPIVTVDFPFLKYVVESN